MSKTIFRNQTNNRKAVLNYEKHILFVLFSGEERCWPNGKRDNPYDRFSEITFKNDGKVAFVQNSKWKPPDGWVTEFLNTGPADAEAFQVDGEFQWFYRGIPRVMEMALADGNIFFSEIDFVPEKNILNHWSGESGRTFEIVVTGIKRTLRPKKDLEKILAEIEAAASKPARSKAERRLRLATGDLKPRDLLGITIEENK